ncbi:MAG: hypothetical protein LBH44_00610 [Treponema sp.]|jgi:hypothetical protein|nr:hypothetical protein [Treponema sp.]
MDAEEKATLKHISDTLDKVLEIMARPQSKVVQMFNIAGTAVGILGILAIIDIIVSWIKS